MLKIEAQTLESAYSQAAEQLSCSITQLNIKIIQTPTSGFLGFFKKQAIIVVIRKTEEAKPSVSEEKVLAPVKAEVKVAPEKVEEKAKVKAEVKTEPKPKLVSKVKKAKAPAKREKKEQVSRNDIILPASFVTDQEEDDYDGSELYEDEEEIYVGEETQICDKSHDEIHQQLAGGFSGAKAASSTNDSFFQENTYSQACSPSEVANEIKTQIDSLFKHACFEIDSINVKEHDEKTILVEFSGKDAALLIGKEGYRYKALSYMLYNWINAKYQLQLRLEIAEFLKNQEEMIGKYLEGVFTNINRDGKAQTKILDGVLVQIALRELRTAYPDKYVAIRSTRDGAKFIIINSFNNSNNNNNNNNY